MERLLRSERDVLVATHEHEVVGFAEVGSVREVDPHFNGELDAIYVLQEYQGQGVGRKLVSAGAKCLRARGHTNMLLWVIADNPATKFYERLGGRRIGESTMMIGGAEIPIVSYGWDDLGVLQ
jgi:ribosomal protein S18 acetylase RimI-like enzyme